MHPQRPRGGTLSRARPLRRAGRPALLPDSGHGRRVGRCVLPAPLRAQRPCSRCAPLPFAEVRFDVRLMCAAARLGPGSRPAPVARSLTPIRLLPVAGSACRTKAYQGCRRACAGATGIASCAGCAAVASNPLHCHRRGIEDWQLTQLLCASTGPCADDRVGFLRVRRRPARPVAMAPKTDAPSVGTGPTPAASTLPVRARPRPPDPPTPHRQR